MGSAVLVVLAQVVGVICRIWRQPFQGVFQVNQKAGFMLNDDDSPGGMLVKHQHNTALNPRIVNAGAYLFGNIQRIKSSPRFK